jgi:peroxiredoxin
VADTASIARFEILDPWGKPHFVPELWAKAPAVLGFVRHFGCIFCHDQVGELRNALPEVERHGARVFIIGNGNPAHALGFADRTGMDPTRVFTDPGRLLYRALGMSHGVGGVRGLRATMGHSLRAWQRGHRQRATEGDPWQQGGTLVIARDGSIAYTYLSRAAGDYAPLGSVLDAVRSLKARG